MAQRPPGQKPRGDGRREVSAAPIRVGGRQVSSPGGQMAGGKGDGRRVGERAGSSDREPGPGELEGSQYKTDEFRMFCLKVLPCSKRYCHDWTTCPFAHPGEKARRRDPRKFRYTGIACPEMKQGVGCPRGERCPFAHNVFEYWLHPSRYRTQLCNIAASCNRKICFFAHTIEELRVPAPVGGVDATQLLAGSAGQALAGGARAPHQQATSKTAHSTPRRAAASEPVRRVAAPEPSPHGPTQVPSSLHGPEHYGQEHYGHDHPAYGHFGPSHDTSTYSESQARQLLDVIRNTRQQALQVHPSVPFADVQQVQALLSILQQQQQRQAAAQKAADSETGMTRALQNCLSALYCQVTTQPMSKAERERLIKMLTWIFMMVQSQSLQAFGGDMQGPWDSPASQRMVLGTGIGLEPPSPATPERATSSFSDRSSLCSIPEMQMASGLDPSISPIQAGMGQAHRGRSNPPWGASQGDAMMLSSLGRLDSGEVHQRRSPSEVGGAHPAMVAQAVTTRLSSESGWSARMSAASDGGWNARMGTPRGSAHSSGESAVTELWGIISRQSGSSTTSGGRLSDMQDAWMHHYRR